MLNIIVHDSAIILKRFSREDQKLLGMRNGLLVLNLRFDIADSIRRLNVEKNDDLSFEGLHENLHTTPGIEGGFLLDVVIRQCASIPKPLSSNDETPRIRQDAKGKISLSPKYQKWLAVQCLLFDLLSLCLDDIESMRSLDFPSDGLSSQSLHSARNIVSNGGTSTVE